MRRRASGGTPARRALLAASVAGGVAISGACTPPPAPEWTGPADHVVVISLDTTRADHLGAYAAEPSATPRLDELARRSVVFDRVYTVAPTTLASHVSLFTGTYPHTHGVPRNGFTVHPDNALMAEILRGHGFTTAAFIASFALDRRFGIDQGFDHFDQQFDQLVGEGGADQNQRRADRVTDAALAWLDRQGVPEHLFLFVHYFDPHAPYDPPRSWRDRFDPAGGTPLPPLADVATMCRGALETPPAVAARYAARYRAEIAFTDEQVGRLLEGLERRGVLERALVLVVTDHGENLCDHDDPFDHGRTLYDSVTRSAGIVRLPGDAGAGRRFPAPISTVDWLPTLARYLGLALPPRVEGVAHDLPPAAGEATPAGERVLFSEATKPWRGVETDPRWPNARKARFALRWPYKLIVTPYLDRVELYDLERDPGERHDLLRGEVPPRIAEIARVLEQALGAFSAAADPLPSSFDETQQQETIDRLRSLGYLD